MRGEAHSIHLRDIYAGGPGIRSLACCSVTLSSFDITSFLLDTHGDLYMDLGWNTVYVSYIECRCAADDIGRDC